MWQDKGRLSRAVRTVAAVMVLGLFVAGCKTELYSGLDERQANEMTAVLMAEGIPASRSRGKDDGFTLRIERNDISRAIAVLSRAGLPRDNFSSLGDIFSADKMVSTPFEERARFMYAMNQELAESITQIGGVTSARVHIMLPETTPLERNPSTARASVFIYHDPATDIATQVPVIKKLIVNSIDGLNYEDVSVALFPNESTLTDTRGLMPSVTGLITGNLGLLALLIPLVLLIIWVQLRRREEESDQKWLLK